MLNFHLCYNSKIYTCVDGLQFHPYKKWFLFYAKNIAHNLGLFKKFENVFSKYYHTNNISEKFYYWFPTLLASNDFLNTLTDLRKWSIGVFLKFTKGSRVPSFTSKRTTQIDFTGLVRVFKKYSGANDILRKMFKEYFGNEIFTEYIPKLA